MKDKNPFELYVRFLNVVRALQEASAEPLPDAGEERMLSFFAIEWAAGRILTVTDAARIDPATPERTAFRRIKALHTKGFLEFATSEQDHRVRYLLPTEQTEHHFLRLSAGLNAVKGSA